MDIPTHIYTGPTTKWGLARGTEVHIVGRRSGGVQVRAARGDSTTYLVGRGQVAKLSR